MMNKKQQIDLTDVDGYDRTNSRELYEHHGKKFIAVVQYLYGQRREIVDSDNNLRNLSRRTKQYEHVVIGTVRQANLIPCFIDEKADLDVMA